ncbi:hypothetical protein GCM10028808_55090 [Spirosoma migulaei]
MKGHLSFLTGLLVLSVALQTLGQSTSTLAQPASEQTFNLMPYPRSLQGGSGKLRLTAAFSIQLSGAATDQTLDAATNRFLRKLNARTLVYVEQQRVVLNNQSGEPLLAIEVNRQASPSIGGDESYQLTIDGTKASLSAPTTLGALRGLETVLQLVKADEKGYYLPEVSISDSPRYPWRGMMVDVARHFLPLDILKRNIDAMATVKLNVLHLHLSDDEGFRVESRVFPKLQELGANGQYYSQAELKELIRYAADRGILVYPEFDLPGHSTSWFAGYPELASAPGPYTPGHRYKIKPGASRGEAIATIMKSATPTIDPTEESTYKFLDKFIAEMTTVFPAPYLHIGADENNGAAWKNNPQIVQFMKQKGFNEVHQLQAYFVNRMHALLKKHHRTTVGWEELYGADLPKDVVVQVWGALGGKRPSPLEIAQQGNPVLISKGFYLDYFYPAYFHYLNANLPSATDPNVLGGEAALWAEVVDENSFETRAWPRTAAVAERLWSPATVIDVDAMYRRLFILSEQLQAGGLNHQLNTERLLASLCNGQDPQQPLQLLQTLAPARGFGRIMTQFTAPVATKYQSVPLVDLPDLISPDSKAAWQFRKAVDTYLKTKDPIVKMTLTNQLMAWKEAAEHIPSLVPTAPNLTLLATYGAKIAQATQIGLQVLEQSPNETDKAALLQTLKGLKGKGDTLEMLILPEIQALVSGTLTTLPMNFGSF